MNKGLLDLLLYLFLSICYYGGGFARKLESTRTNSPPGIVSLISCRCVHYQWKWNLMALDVDAQVILHYNLILVPMPYIIQSDSRELVITW